MPHHNIVFHDLLKLLPWGTFDELVDKHKADADARGLRSKSHLIALLYGQLPVLRACVRLCAAWRANLWLFTMSAERR